MEIKPVLQLEDEVADEDLHVRNLADELEVEIQRTASARRLGVFIVTSTSAL